MSHDTKETIEKLRSRIRIHDRLYYVLHQPEISDRQYDRLFTELKSLEQANPQYLSPDSPTQRVSEQPIEGFTQITHSVAMLSMDNTYNSDELRAFDKRVAKGLASKDYYYVVELKIDGVAISLRYENGVLTTAATRGDGRRGDDVTANIRTIKSVPLTLLDGGNVPEIIEVRGEVYMPVSAFTQLNKTRADSGEPAFANPRNAAAGSLKLLDARITADRNLSFFAYSLGEVSQPLADDHWLCLEKLKAFGLPVNPNIRKASDIEQAINICLSWSEKRDSLDYQIDGMVIKVARLVQRDLLGATARAPRWCISYKFPAAQARTILESIDVQVGKSGILTPVANLKPVQLAGTVVKRASLHNFDELARLDVREGDTVIIEKAGEIIPQVVEVKKELRPGNVGIFQVPAKCPYCKGPVEKDPEGVYIRCRNPNCLAQLKERLKYFAGRGQMDIENLGEALIEQLVETSLVRNFADIYELQKDDLLSLERMAEKSASNCIAAIEKSKTQPLWRLIAALGIRHIGGQSAQILADHFSSIDALAEAVTDQLEAIDQIGPTMAQSICEYFTDKDNHTVIEQMLTAGVKPPVPKKTFPTGPLAGKIVVLTGTLKNFTRTQAGRAITDAGGKTSSSVSKKTDFVLAGDNPGSKLDKAEKLGVKVIDEEQFSKMIES